MPSVHRRLFGHTLRIVRHTRLLKARIRQGCFGGEVCHRWSAQLACGAGHVGAAAGGMIEKFFLY